MLFYAVTIASLYKADAYPVEDAPVPDGVTVSYADPSGSADLAVRLKALHGDITVHESNAALGVDRWVTYSYPDGTDEQGVAEPLLSER